MRKIEIKENKEKKEQRKKRVIGVILLVIMVLSSLGYAVVQSDKKKQDKIIYEGTEFSLVDNIWYARINNQDFYFFYKPQDTENISYSATASLLDYSSNPLYFSYDSDKEAIDEISRNIGRFASRIQYACLDECKEDFPVKNCTDNIIIIKESNLTEIKQEDNCIYIFSKKEDVLRAADAFIFRTAKKAGAGYG